MGEQECEKGARALLFLPEGKRCAHRDIHCSLFTECGSGDRSNAQESGRGQTPGATLRTVTELYCTPKGQAHSPPRSALSQLFSACTFTPSLLSHTLAECPLASRAPKDLLVLSLVLQNPVGSQAQGWGSTGGEFWSCSRRNGQGRFLTAIQIPPNLLGKIKNKSKNPLSRVLQKQTVDLSGSEIGHGGLLNSSSWMESWCAACAGPSSVLHLSPLRSFTSGRA